MISNFELSQVTYIWIDGAKPTQKLRSKTRILKFINEPEEASEFAEWSFDGSSTYQAVGSQSDLILRPVCFVVDPLLGPGNYLVMCEVFNPDGSPHITNTRAKLRLILDEVGFTHQPWVGFEQEYTLFQGRDPLGWPSGGYPAPQGPFYCGVGADEVFGRELSEEHTQACLEAGLMIFGTNAEVMPGQWEFQIGYRNIAEESADPLTVSDHLWLARWLLYRVGEEYNITANLESKPVKGDWNGAGCHTNFSTASMRDSEQGSEAITKAIANLSIHHDKHIAHYGHRLDERLTGKHETAHISKFTSGVSDRSCSIRVPASVAKNSYGYIEDRRPGANIDPYTVSRILLETICECVLDTVSS